MILLNGNTWITLEYNEVRMQMGNTKVELQYYTMKNNSSLYHCESSKATQLCWKYKPQSYNEVQYQLESALLVGNS